MFFVTDDRMNRDEVESQLRKLLTRKLTDISPDFTEKVSPEEFWIVVRRMENQNGQKRFYDLANLSLRALISPTGNADIERIFSVMTIVKNKIRNRMLRPMLRVYGY